MSIYLADVSEFQPNINDTEYVAWSEAVIIRAAYGTSHTDLAWYGGARRTDLHAAGIKFLGIYQYLVNGQSGASQAQAFHTLVGPIQDGEVFIADFEEGSQPMLTDWYNEMITLYGAGIGNYLWTYTGLDFGETAGIMPVQWVADYPDNYPDGEPSSPHVLWQFTDSYDVPGIGACDCSQYEGTISELVALGYGTAPAPPPLIPDFHVTSPPPGWWDGQITLSGTGTDGKTVWYTASGNGINWTEPSETEPSLTGDTNYHVTVAPPGWWTKTIVLGGNGTDGVRWHTSSSDGAHWSAPTQ
jgi:hypothetical protein